MLTSLRSMSDERAQRINLLADCGALTVAAFAAGFGAGQLHWMVAPGLALVSVLIWTVQSRILRHYDAANGRNIGSDVVLTLLTLAIMICILAVLRPIVPRYAAGSDLTRFGWIAAPLILWVRLTINWVRRREMTARRILVVGIGPLGRHTALEMVAASSDSSDSARSRCTTACRPPSSATPRTSRGC
jgi:FlaA1/EpsC-like NDP-sugar epimerase